MTDSNIRHRGDTEGNPSEHECGGWQPLNIRAQCNEQLLDEGATRSPGRALQLCRRPPRHGLQTVTRMSLTDSYLNVNTRLTCTLSKSGATPRRSGPLCLLLPDVLTLAGPHPVAPPSESNAEQLQDGLGSGRQSTWLPWVPADHPAPTALLWSWPRVHNLSHAER